MVEVWGNCWWRFPRFALYYNCIDRGMLVSLYLEEFTVLLIMTEGFQKMSWRHIVDGVLRSLLVVDVVPLLIRGYLLFCWWLLEISKRCIGDKLWWKYELVLVVRVLLIERNYCFVDYLSESYYLELLLKALFIYTEVVLGGSTVKNKLTTANW